MSIEHKILIYWVVLTIVLWILARIQFHIFGTTNLRWKYWAEEYGFGVWYMVVSRIGFWVGLGYYFLQLTIWWFKL